MFISIFRKKIISLVLIFSISASHCPIYAFSFSSFFNFFSKKTKTAQKIESAQSAPSNLTFSFAVGVLLGLAFLLLLKNFNEGGNVGNRPSLVDLKQACKDGDFEKAKDIFDNNEDKDNDLWLNLGRHNGDSSFHHACKSGKLELVEVCFNQLKDKRRNRDFTGKSIFESACEGGNDEIFKFLVRVEFDRRIDYSNELYKSPLHVACSFGKLDLVRWLVEEMGYDVNLENRFGFTPLYKGHEKGHTRIVEYLISKGARQKE